MTSINQKIEPSFLKGRTLNLNEFPLHKIFTSSGTYTLDLAIPPRALFVVCVAPGERGTNRGFVKGNLGAPGYYTNGVGGRSGRVVSGLLPPLLLGNNPSVVIASESSNRTSFARIGQIIIAEGFNDKGTTNSPNGSTGYALSFQNIGSGVSGVSTAAGTGGAGYGGGGAGGAASSSPGRGGAGASGLVLIFEFY